MDQYAQTVSSVKEQTMVICMAFQNARLDIPTIHVITFWKRKMYTKTKPHACTETQYVRVSEQIGW